MVEDLKNNVIVALRSILRLQKDVNLIFGIMGDVVIMLEKLLTRCEGCGVVATVQGAIASPRFLCERCLASRLISDPGEENLWENMDDIEAIRRLRGYVEELRKNEPPASEKN